MTELWVKDRYGNARDIIIGYDNNVSENNPKEEYDSVLVSDDAIN